MKRIDCIKPDVTRNWKLHGKERLSNLLKSSAQLNQNISNGIVWLTNEDIAICVADIEGGNLFCIPA
jgi:hypothetical protein